MTHPGRRQRHVTVDDLLLHHPNVGVPGDFGARNVSATKYGQVLEE